MKEMEMKDLERITASIDFHGEFTGEFIDWYYDARKIFEKLGYEPTHICSSNMNGGVKTIKRCEKRCIKEMTEHTTESLEISTLPKDYLQSVFHYFICIYRDDSAPGFQITFNKSYLEKLDIGEVVRTFKKYMIDPTIEVYELARSESPYMYFERMNMNSVLPHYVSLKKLIPEQSVEEWERNNT